MATIPAAVVLLAVAGLLVAALVRKPHGETSTKSFFLMGQNAGPVLLSVSYCATLLSAFTFVGLPGFFYSHGVGTWLFVPFCNVAAVLLLLVFGSFFRRLQERFQTYSPLDIIAKAYGSRRLGFVAFCISTVFIVPHLAVQIAGFSKLATSFGLDYQLAAFGLLGVFVLYTMVAGMWGDVWTDFWQALIMGVGLWVVAAVLLQSHWGSEGNELAAMFAAVESERGAAQLSLPGGTGFFSYLALLSYVLMFMSVTVVQSPYAMRILIARGEKDLRIATAALPWLLLVFFLPTFLIGIAGSAIYPDLASGDLLIGTVLLDHFGGDGLGQGLFLGAVLVGLTFAVLSTVDSQLLALGATFSRDVYRSVIEPEASEVTQIRVSRIAMVVVAVLAFIVALNPPRLIIQLSILSVAGTFQMLPVFLAGVLRRRPPSVGSAYASLIVGLGTFAVLQWTTSRGLLGGLHAGVVGMIAGTAAMVAFESAVRHAGPHSPGSEATRE